MKLIGNLLLVISLTVGALAAASSYLVTLEAAQSASPYSLKCWRSC